MDCGYLREARKRDEPPVADPSTFPNSDIRIGEQFLREHEALLLFLSVELLEAALELPNVIDSDMRDALDGLVRTYRTMQSGLYYESRPDNLLAGAIYDRVQAAVARVREAAAAGQQSSLKFRDAEALGILAFLQRMEIQRRNGRRLGRAFIDFLRIHFPQAGKAPAGETSLIV